MQNIKLKNRKNRKNRKNKKTFIRTVLKEKGIAKKWKKIYYKKYSKI